MRSISNDRLRPDDVPSPDADWDAIQAFALTFDGYSASGSFEACAEIANRGEAATLTELRTCLFFEQRRWRHFGEEPDGDDLAGIRRLVELIRICVERDHRS
jgi:hypothetical protein